MAAERSRNVHGSNLSSIMHHDCILADVRKAVKQWGLVSSFFGRQETGRYKGIPRRSRAQCERRKPNLEFSILKLRKKNTHSFI